MGHPLDRPIWNALTSRQAALAQVAGAIRRYDPAYAPFAASYDGTADSLKELSELVPLGGQIILQQTHVIEQISHLRLVRTAATVQMIATQVKAPIAAFRVEELSDGDASEMRALAALARPGPFAERTHELGHFIGVRCEGRLVAMAGERMKLDGFTEVSGVCTHPDHRGHGYGAVLTALVAEAILQRGETPFLHAFESNVGAIALYERLGFVVRWRPALMVYEAA